MISIDAMRLSSSIQLLGILLFHLSMLIYSAIQINQVSKALPPPSILFGVVQPYLLAVPIVSGVGLVGLAGVGWGLSREFGWSVYERSADLGVRRMTLWYEAFITLLKVRSSHSSPPSSLSYSQSV